MDDRIFQSKDGLWRYRTRGGQIIGPFESREEAEAALEKQLRMWGAAPAPKAVWRSWRPGKLFGGSMRSPRRSGTRQR